MTERQRWFNLKAVGLQAASSYQCFGCLLVVEDMYQIDPHLLVGTWPKKNLATGNRMATGTKSLAQQNAKPASGSSGIASLDVFPREEWDGGG